MKQILISLLAIASFSCAASSTGCVLVQPKKMKVSWRGYKTPEKIGVDGEFTAVTYTPNTLEGKNFRELFVGSKVTIDTAGITTGNPERDETLVRFFFSTMSSNTIEAKILDIKRSDKHEKGKPRTGTLSVEITMNGKIRTVPMHYFYDKGKFNATGTIDLLDFAAGRSLASINKACFDLHKGKTWSDVTISFSTTVEATLCHVNIAQNK